MYNYFVEFMIKFYDFIIIRYFLVAGCAFLFFYVILKKQFFYRKIQKKYASYKSYLRDIIYSIITIFIFTLVIYETFSNKNFHTNIYEDNDKYGYVYFAFTYIWMFFLHDFYFYWMHRLVHLKYIFKWGHLTHHISTNPSPWTAYAFDPIEAVLEIAIIPLIAFTLPVSVFALESFLFFQILYNVYIHLGYEIFPQKLGHHWLGKWINTSVSHNVHHKLNKGNYGLYTLIWDRLFGTINDKYDKVFDEVTSHHLKDIKPPAN